MTVGIGFLEPLYRAITAVILFIHSGLVSVGLDPSSGAAWALAIVLLTVAMRVLLFPLFVKQIQSSRKMQALQPKMKELQQKYKNDKQRLNQEMMKLYQEHGANPLGGCLPLLVQLPIFYGLFTVLRNIALHNTTDWGLTQTVVESASNATIFGASIAARFLNTSFTPGSTTDQLISFGGSSASAKAVALVLVLISSTTMFLTMRHSMRRSTMQQGSDNPAANMQKMMLFMAPVFGIVTLWLPIGVLIYIVTTNVWTLGQNYFIYWKYPAAGGAAGGAAAAGESGGGSDGSGPRPAAAGEGSGDGKRGSGPTAPTGPAAAQRVVRQQPVNRPRSKRTGSRKR